VGIAGGGLDLAVAEQFADHRQPLPTADSDRGKGMTKIVDMDVLDGSALADTLPWRLEVG